MTEELPARELTTIKLTVDEVTAEDDGTAEEAPAQESPEEGGFSPTASTKVDLPIAPRTPLISDKDPSYSTCIDRPLIIAGQVFGITVLLGVFFWILASGMAAVSASAAIPSSIAFTAIWKSFLNVIAGGLLFFYTTEWLSAWLRLPKVTAFIAAMYDPIFHAMKLVPFRGLSDLDILSIRGFAKSFRGSKQFAEAAVCYSRVLSSLSPLSIDRLKYERFYVFSLFYDGQTDRAIQYSEALLEYWQGVTKDVTRVNTVRRLGYAVYTRAALYYLVGDKESACRLQHAFYETAKKVPSPNEALTIAMLCEGQALLNEQKFESARSLLSDCCRSLKWNTPNDLKMAAHQAYALSLAHCDDKTFALKQIAVAERHCAADDERLSNALAKVEIFKTINDLDSARKTIKDTIEKLHPAPDSVMFESLRKVAESINAPELLIAIQSENKCILTEPSEHSVSDLPAAADQQRPSALFFQNYSGLGFSDLPPFVAALVAMASVEFFKSAANAPVLYGFLALLIGARIYQLYWGRRNGAAAKAALSSASRVTYFGRTDGHGGLVLIDPSEMKDIETIYASPSLLREVKKTCGEDLFEVTVFKKNGPIAIEIFGCYSAVSRSAYIP